MRNAKMKKKKKKRCSQSQSDGLPIPEAILFEILLRLPVKSLCRFRCVSTLWRSIIGDPLFVSSHFDRSTARPKLLMCVDEFERPAGNSLFRRKGKFFFSVDYPENSDDLRQVASYHGRISSTGKYISRSGGLICIDAADGIQICNPSTGECVTFPNPSARASDSFLGYDPVGKKHKIINSVASCTKDPAIEIRILTLGEKDWRRIDPGIANVCLLRNGLCIDGVMHLFGATADRDMVYLMLFDLRLESFRVIPFPEEFKFHGRVFSIEFDGGAALLDIGSDFTLWVLGDLDKQIWSCKRFTPPPTLDDAISDEPHYIAGVTHAGEVVFSPIASTVASYLYLYHMKDASFRKIELHGFRERLHVLPHEDCDMNTVCYHVESLQSLQHLHIDL